MVHSAIAEGDVVLLVLDARIELGLVDGTTGGCELDGRLLVGADPACGEEDVSESRGEVPRRSARLTS